MPQETAGILGLCRKGLGDFQSGPRFLDSIYTAGLVDSNIFNFYLTNTNGQSFLDIGSIVDSHIKPNSEIAWL